MDAHYCPFRLMIIYWSAVYIRFKLDILEDTHLSLVVINTCLKQIDDIFCCFQGLE